VDGYVARFDSDVIGDSGVMPNTLSFIPSGPLSKDITANETTLMSHAILSNKPASNFKHVMTDTVQTTAKGCSISAVPDAFIITEFVIITQGMSSHAIDLVCVNPSSSWA